MKSLITGNIQRILSERHIKHKAFAESVGLTPHQFCDLLHGRRMITDIDVWNIACVLSVSPNDLFQGISKSKFSHK